MFLKLADKRTASDFKSLSLDGKKKLLHRYVLDNWGDVSDVDHCYTYVMFGDQVLAFADINAETKVDDVAISFDKASAAKEIKNFASSEFEQGRDHCNVKRSC